MFLPVPCLSLCHVSPYVSVMFQPVSLPHLCLCLCHRALFAGNLSFIDLSQGNATRNGRQNGNQDLECAVRCSVLQCAAVCCSVLQRVAVCCGVLH